MVPDIDQIIPTAVASVFGTMLNFSIVTEPDAIREVNEGPHVVGAVTFVGTMNGVVYLQCGDPLARRITGGLLGLDQREIDGHEMVNDAMGEMTNMVVGHLKTRLVDRGMSCVMSIPSVVRGNDFLIEPLTGSERRAYFFRCEGTPLQVEVIMKLRTK